MKEAHWMSAIWIDGAIYELLLWRLCPVKNNGWRTERSRRLMEAAAPE